MSDGSQHCFTTQLSRTNSSYPSKCPPSLTAPSEQIYYIYLCLRDGLFVWEQPVCFWQCFSLVLTLLAHTACRRWPWACHVWTKTTVFAISAPPFHIPVRMPLAPVLSKSGAPPISMPVISRPAIHLSAACWRGTWQLNNYSLGRGKREQKPVDCDSIIC